MQKSLFGIVLYYVWEFMKLSTLVSIIICSCCTVSLAKESHAQEVLNKPVTLHLKQVSLTDALDAISRQAAVKFVYTGAHVDHASKVSLSVKSTRLKEVLPKLLQPSNLDYKVVDDMIVINPAAPVKPQAPPKFVKGKVTDRHHQPLPGVTVKVKGTNTGITTDNEGNYRLQIPDDDAVLIFSSLGFTPQTIPVNGRDVIDITLDESAKSMSEVVVVGYGTQKRSDVTGAIASVKGAETVNQPARSVADLLQARTAGVEVVKNTGDPEGSTSIYIRGATSFNNPGPLYVVDGVPQGNTGNNFNTQDIESIEVLKDASSASIYGAAAAGGVILVTTKRGAMNKRPTVAFNAYDGVTRPIFNKLLDRDDFIKARANMGQDLTGGVAPAKLPNVDWVNALYQNGVQQNYDLSVAGGNDHSKFYLSAGYSNQKGNVIENSFKKYAVRINSDHNIGKLFKVGESVLIWNTQNRPTVNGGGFPYRTRPDMAIYDSTNVTGGGWGKAPEGFGGPNYVGAELSNEYHNDNNAVEGNMYGIVNIIEGLSLKGVFGYSNINYYSSVYKGAYDFGPVRNTDPTLTKTANNAKELSTTITLNFDRTFGKHTIRALAGYEQRKGTYSNMTGTADSLALPHATNFFVTSNVNQYVTGGIGYGLLKSLFGRINYEFAQKYIAEVSLRHDGDFYRFGPRNSYGNFPSASVAWRMIEEPFIKENLTFLSDLKLRAGYGVVGNNNIPAYLFLARYYDVGGFSFANNGSKTIAYGVDILPNVDIKWETTHELNIGLDFAMMKNRLTVSADFYNKQTQGILYNLALPPSSGIVQAFTTNVGKIRNKGFEFLATWQDRAGDFQYSVSANASFNRNKVLQLDGTNNNPIFSGDNNIAPGFGIMNNQSISRSAVGRSLGEFYGYIATGIYQTDGEAAKGPTVNGQKPHAGDLIFRDLNGDGIIDDKDRDYMGNPNPKMNYGLNLNLRYKWIDVGILLQGVQGVQVFNGRQPYNQSFFGDGNTSRDIFKTSFFGDNGLTNQPRVVYKDAGGNYNVDPYTNYARISSWWVENGAYLKLQNLQIGFNLPQQWLTPVKLASARFFVMGSNLFTITGYKGLDPQVQAMNVISRGIDGPSYYPQNRLYAIGLNVTY
ncbi:hypothetical protein UNH65_12150 [Chitinophaga sp. 180180018-2]|uniref:TonB-dependent receptor n=2 Tax=Chitinophaga TaxID=79328 RepID=UPI002DEF6F61|nr:hypothetical protein [Chitinophaga sp. 212800010-3]